PAPWPGAPGSCCWTSRSAPSTHSPGCGCRTSSSRCTRPPRPRCCSSPTTWTRRSSSPTASWCSAPQRTAPAPASSAPSPCPATDRAAAAPPSSPDCAASCWSRSASTAIATDGRTVRDGPPETTTTRNRSHTMRSARLTAAAAAALTVVVPLSGCLAGEAEDAADASAGPSDGDELVVDWATYNPLSLVIRDQGWLEEALADDGVDVTWVQSAGSNRANELLRSGEADVASTAGSAALLARANGSPIRTFDIYSQPEWSALVTDPGSGIEE